MRLTYNNIKFVKDMTLNGVTREIYVGMKDNYASSGRFYYQDEEIPVTVQRFMRDKMPEVFDEFTYGDNTYTTYIYRA